MFGFGGSRKRRVDKASKVQSFRAHDHFEVSLGGLSRPLLRCQFHCWFVTVHCKICKAAVFVLW